MVLKLEEEGDQRFDLVDEDLIQLCEDLSDVDQKVQPHSDSQEELENHILKLEMHVGRLSLEWQIVKEEKQPAQAPGETNNPIN